MLTNLNPLAFFLKELWKDQAFEGIKRIWERMAANLEGRSAAREWGPTTGSSTKPARTLIAKSYLGNHENQLAWLVAVFGENRKNNKSYIRKININTSKCAFIYLNYHVYIHKIYLHTQNICTNSEHYLPQNVKHQQNKIINNAKYISKSTTYNN